MWLNPREARLLVRFLDAVDSVVTSRLIPDAKVDEPHLTSTLRETLDERFTGFHALPYSLAQLKDDLRQDDTSLRISLSIEAKEYSHFVENRINQADLGIIIRYDNFFRPIESFTKAALFQAKRVYSSHRNYSKTYSENDRFEGFDVAQLLRIVGLTQRHSNLLYYLFYCPRPEVLDEQSRRVLKYLTLPTRPEGPRPHHWIDEFGLAWWSHLEEYASDTNRHFPGLIASTTYWLRDQYLEHEQSAKDDSRWVPKPKQAAPSVRDVYDRLWKQTHALSWFVVYRLLMGYEGTSDDEAISLARGDVTAQDLGVAPRYTLELRITVGGEGPG
jgi:hypothetical protein